MDRFDSMRAFVTAVDEGGFAAAGRKLGVSRVQVSRLVGALEDHLGTQLLERTTRTMALTEPGRVFVERARALVAQLEEAEAAAGSNTGALTGFLQVHAPTSFGVSEVAPAMSDFMALHPHLPFLWFSHDRFVDPLEEGFDVALQLLATWTRPVLCPARYVRSGD
jgi:DNA-binding transcriptional LysR family regulator